MVVKGNSTGKKAAASSPQMRGENRYMKHEPEEEEFEEEELQHEQHDHESRPEATFDDGLFPFSMDPKLLNCPACAEPLRPPVYQCHKGHVKCSTCFVSDKVCTFCCVPLMHYPCTTLEEIVESIRVRCSNADRGCKERLRYAWKNAHEEACSYAPCQCPISNCTFTCSPRSLSAHIRGLHARSSTQIIGVSYYRSCKVLLQKAEPFMVLHGKVDDQVFLLVNSFTESMRPLRVNSLSMVCYRSGSPEWTFSCELTVRSKGRAYNLKFSPPNIKRLGGFDPAEPALFVPCDFREGRIIVDVRIRKEKAMMVG